jgi:hypothetical protein
MLQGCGQGLQQMMSKPYASADGSVYGLGFATTVSTTMRLSEVSALDLLPGTLGKIELGLLSPRQLLPQRLARGFRARSCFADCTMHGLKRAPVPGLVSPAGHKISNAFPHNQLAILAT